MDKHTAMQKAKVAIEKLPENKVQELIEFAEFLVSKNEDTTMQNEIYHLVENDKAFDWLKEEENLYTPADYKVTYHTKG